MLKKLSFLSKGQPTTLGKALKEIDSPFAILIIQLINNNFFHSLQHKDIACLMVCLVEEEKASTDRFRVKQVELREKISEMISTGRKLVKVYK